MTGIYLFDDLKRVILKVKIIFHYPGQLIKKMEKADYQVMLKEIETTNEIFEETVSRVSVLKNRPDSYLPCYNGDLSDDVRSRQEIFTSCNNTLHVKYMYILYTFFLD